MRFSSSLVALAAAAFSGTSLAASLSDFNPKVNNLPSNCQTVYTAAIVGCSGSDFTPGGSCSPSCIKGLQAMTSFVQMACTGINFQSTNLISVFMSGMGPATLCPNLSSSSNSNSPTTSVQKTTSAATTSPASTGSAQSTGSTTSSTKTTANSSSTGTSSTNTGSTTTSTGQISMQTSPTSSPQASPQSQCTSRGSGGSPFDIQGTTACSSAGSLTIWTGSTMLLAAMVILGGI